MLFGSNRLNVTLLTSLVTFLSVIGCFYIQFSIGYLIVSILSFYALNILGNWMTLHRYYSHKSFDFKNEFLKQVFSMLAILSMRGSILGWVYIHRQHHLYSDTEKDPHSPNNVGLKLFGFTQYKNIEEENVKLFLIKDLMTKYHLFVHKFYFLIIMTFILALAIIDVNVLYFGYIIPTFLVHISQNLFNYYGHKKGYRTYETKDNSTNNIWLFPLILGECWHNNHHHSPKYHSTKNLKKELDPLNYIIQLVGNVQK